MSTEIEVEPVPGLPSLLPAGERILWQGRPEWRALARHTFRLPYLAAYFAVFVTIRAIVARQEGQGMHGALQVLLGVALGVGCIGVLTLVAWLNARATVYTITTRRLVMRIGVALPTTFNLPFKALASADVKSRKAGDGDIVLKIAGSDRIAWLHLWPHAQPWHMKTARPMLRAIAEPDYVAGVLADAVRAWAQAEAASVKVVPRAPHEPMLEIGIMAPARVQHELATEAGR